MESDAMIDSIDQVYYKDEGVFNLDHITEQLPQPDGLTSQYLLDYKSRLECLLTVTSRKVSELILSHQPAYINELQRIASLQKSITESIRVCSKGRRCLKYIKDGTSNGLTIIDHHRRRESLTKLLKTLSTINSLRKTVVEMRKMIDNQEDFPQAIQMCNDGQTQLSPYVKFTCVNDLRSKLNDTLEIIGERMDTVLSKMFISYDPETYRKLNTAYTMMNRGEIAVGQLSMHFNAYHNSSIEELKMFLENELWEMLPVKCDFTLVQLKEFSFLRETSDLLIHKQRPIEPILFAEPSDAETSERAYERVSPSNNALDRISLSSDSELDSDLDKDYIDEDSPPMPKSTKTGENDSKSESKLPDNVDNLTTSSYRLTQSPGPVLTNSSLNVLRLAGRYIQMMTVLTPITYEILTKVYKLLDLYVIFVFKKFGPDNDKQAAEVIASLREALISPAGIRPCTLESTTETLFGVQLPIGDDKKKTTNQRSTDDNQRDDIRPIDSKKAIAIESLVFLVNQFWNLQEYLESLITAEQRIQLREQFSQTSQSMIPDFLKVRAKLCQTDE